MEKQLFIILDERSTYILNIKIRKTFKRFFGVLNFSKNIFLAKIREQCSKIYFNKLTDTILAILIL